MDRRVLAVVGSVSALFVAFLARGVLLSVGRVVLVAVALALVVGLGLVLTRTPAYRRTTVGAATRVLRRPLDATNETTSRHRCAECDEPVTDGERRRFVREWVLFGVPLILLVDGENVYCSSCADGETGEFDGELDTTEADNVATDERVREK